MNWYISSTNMLVRQTSRSLHDQTTSNQQKFSLPSILSPSSEFLLGPPPVTSYPDSPTTYSRNEYSNSRITSWCTSATTPPAKESRSVSPDSPSLCRRPWHTYDLRSTSVRQRKWQSASDDDRRSGRGYLELTIFLKVHGPNFEDVNTAVIVQEIEGNREGAVGSSVLFLAIGAPVGVDDEVVVRLVARHDEGVFRWDWSWSCFDHEADGGQ